MPPASTTLTVVLQVRDQLTRAVTGIRTAVQGGFGGLTSGVRSLGAAFTSFLSGPFGAFTAALGLNQIGQLFVAKLREFAVELVQLGIEAEAVGRRFAAAFGTDSATATSALGTTADALGRSVSDLQQFATGFEQAAREIGATDAQARALAVTLAQLTPDLAASAGATDANAYEALRSAILGSTRSLREFNIVLTEEEVKAEAVRLGASATATSLTSQQKSVASLSLIFNELSERQGSAADASATFGGKLTELRARIKDVKDDIALQLNIQLAALIDELGGAKAIAEELRAPLQLLGAGFSEVAKAVAIASETIDVFTFLYKEAKSLVTTGDLALAPAFDLGRAQLQQAQREADARVLETQVAVPAATPQALTALATAANATAAALSNAAVKEALLFKTFADARDAFGTTIPKSFDQQRLSIEALTHAREQDIAIIAQQLGLFPNQVKLLRDLSDQTKALALEEVDLAQARQAEENARAARTLQYQDFLRQNATVLQGLQAFGRGFEDAFVSFATGARTAKEAFSDFARGLLADIARLLIRGLALRSVLGLGGALGLDSGFLGQFFGGGNVTSAKGNAFDAGRVLAFQRGGIISAPTLFPLGLAGERGPEAILPLQRDGSGNLGVRSAGGGGGGVNVIINVSAVDARSVDALFFDRRETLRSIISDALVSSPAFRGAIQNTRR